MSGLLGGAGVAALAIWTPSGDPDAAICLLRREFHLPCPGCGMTRAISALLHGDWPGAWALHPLALPIAVQAAAGWGLWGVRLLWRPEIEAPLASWWIRLLLINVGLLFVVWAVRLSRGTLPL